MTPRSHAWHLNGLDHHVLEWGETHDARGTAVIVHGFQDAAATWDDVAVELARAGLRVLAPDMRGFGDGPRVPPGAYYYFPDYVADLAALVALHADAQSLPLFLIGHSMGATVVAYFAGAFPERLTKLALIDGLGPPDMPADTAPGRMRRWIEGERDRGQDGKPMTREDALARLKRFNPLASESVLARNLPRVSRPADTLDGGDKVVWKGDPLHMTTSPVPFYAEAYKAFARRVACPVLYVSGGERGFHVPDEDERLACFARLSRVTLEGGHGLHWTMPRELSAALVTFWNA
jgi:pimeloyl-ACP methyl ester carboxylesterase